MNSDAYDATTALAVDLRDVARRLEALKKLTDYGDHPYGELLATSVLNAAEASSLAAALDAFSKHFYASVTVEGEHEIALLARHSARYVTIACGWDGEDEIVQLKDLAETDGASWHAFEVGIGASASEVFVEFASAIAAAVVVKYVERARATGPNQVTVSEGVATDIAIVDAKTRFGDGLEFEHCHAIPAVGVEHAKFEVVLKVRARPNVLRYLVRANGEIIGYPPNALNASGGSSALGS